MRPIRPPSRSTSRTPRALPGPLVLALLLAGAVGAAPAWAATYYLGPGGSDTNPGTSPGSPWATLGKANAMLRAGDVLIIANGTYSGFPNPGASGTSSARITYVGNLSDPSRVVVSGGTLNRSYVTLKGMSFGGVTIAPNGTAVAQRDSIAWSVMSSLALQGTKHCVIARNTIAKTGGGVLRLLSSNGDQLASGFANCQYNIIRGNTIRALQIGTDDIGFRIAGGTQYSVIDSNTYTATFSASTYLGRSNAFRLHWASYNVLADNVMNVSAENLPAGQGWVFYSLRDSSHNNKFVRNRYNTTGSYPIEFFQSTSGDDARHHDVYQNVWDSCRWDIRTPAPSTYPGLIWQDGMMSDTLRNCVVKNDGYGCLVIPSVRGGALPNGRPNVSVIDHNTLYGITNSSTSPISLDLSSSTFESGASLRITNNILYTGGSSATGSRWNSAYGVRVPSNVSFQSDRNLIAHYAGASKSIWYEVSGSTGYTGPGSSGWLCQNGASRGWGSGADCSSVYGSPMFMDSTRTNFDPRLRSGSPARLAALDGTDLGAGLSAPVGDASAPAAISDLRSTLVSDHTVVLAWTAPGDDGTFGTASAYELRWSTQPITAANFGSANLAGAQPVPASSGTLQTYVAVDLTASTTYYWAIRTRDEAGNWSGISNTLVTPTTATDGVAPNAIQDLSTAGGS